MDLELTSRPSPVRCAVCHDELAAAPVPCDGCGTALHAECKAAVHGCPTIGCRNRLAPVVEAVEDKSDRERARARRLGVVALVNGAAALYVAGLCHLLLGRAPPESTLPSSPVALAFGASALLGALTLVLAVPSWRRSWLGTAALAMEIAWLILTGPQLVELLAWSRPLTEAEVREFADRIDRGHQSVFERIDVDAMLRQGDPFRASLPEDEQRGMRVRFREFQVANAKALAEEGGSVKVLPLTDARPTVVVRLVDRDGGLTYHEYVLDRGRDGDPTCSAVRDLRLLESWFTMTSHIMRASSRTRHQLQRLATLLNDDQPEAALRAFRRMGASLKADRGILLARLNAAQQVGEDEAEALADVISTTTVGDPAILRWELARLRGEDAASLEALDAIDRLVGTDPFLDALRADVQNAEGGSPVALELAKRATQALPDVEATWWSLLECAVPLRDHTNTRAALEKLVGTFRNEPLDIEESLDLSVFFNSADGAAWLAREPDDR